jgi:surface antigen
MKETESMKSLMALPLAAALALSLTACQSNTTDGWGTKQTVGTLGGAAAGGLLGSRIGGGTGNIIATAAGTLLGAYIGSEIGSSLDKADKAQYAHAERQAYAAPVGQAINWNNPQSGNYGTITPVRDGRDQSGNYCREFQQSIVVGGKTQQAYGQACQQPDGSWKIVQ